MKKAVGHALRLCPFGLQARAIDKLINRVFQEPMAQGDFELFENRCIGIVINDLDYRLNLTCRNHRLSAVTLALAPEVAIIADSLAFLQLAIRQEDPDSLFFARRLSIEGDVELGLAVKNMMDSVDLDSFPTWLQHLVKAAERVTSITKLSLSR